MTGHPRVRDPSLDDRSDLRTRENYPRRARVPQLVIDNPRSLILSDRASHKNKPSRRRVGSLLQGNLSRPGEGQKQRSGHKIRREDYGNDQAHPKAVPNLVANQGPESVLAARRTGHIDLGVVSQHHLPAPSLVQKPRTAILAL